MRNASTWWMIGVIMLLLDIYVYQAVKTVSQYTTDKTRLTIQITYWVLSIVTLTCLLLLPYVQFLQTNKIFRNYVFSILIGLFLAKMLASTFFVIDDARRLILWVFNKITSSKEMHITDEADTISRSTFFSWMGLGLGGTLFGTLLYGFSNKYNYQIKQIALHFSNLPKAFDKLKLVQISDVHSGSFTDKMAVQKGIDAILAEQPDIIVFTGDLVNDRHEEMLEYIDIFKQLKAPMGVYSILGNHDYGDYVQWPSQQAKQENLEKLKAIHAKMGWKLLMNEHIVFERNSEKMALLGIENFGAKGRFPKYGKLDEAYKGTEAIPFKILLSHDPSHWDYQVKKEYPDVDLMLSGHTHGMQFGIENPYMKWSPVQWMYKQWAGLYEDGKQKLYVNRGFGFIGYPGRVGILPEITVFTFDSNA